MELFEKAYRSSKWNLDKEDQLSEEEIQSFLNQRYDTVILQKGKILWRFYSQKKYNVFSNCWVDDETMKKIMRSFQASGRFDLRYKKEFIRDNLAILQGWSHIQYRVKIKIMAHEGIIAHKGIIAPQKRFGEINPRSEVFTNSRDNNSQMLEQRLGGLIQYVIPRLKDHSLSQPGNQYARVLHKAHI